MCGSCYALQVNLTDGLAYLAAARSNTGSPLFYTISLPAGSLVKSFQLKSVVLVRLDSVLLTGIAADGHASYTYEVNDLKSLILGFKSSNSIRQHVRGTRTFCCVVADARAAGRVMIMKAWFKSFQALCASCTILQHVPGSHESMIMLMPLLSLQASGACDISQDCTIRDLTTFYSWGDLSAVILSAANVSIDTGTLSNPGVGRRRLSQTVGFQVHGIFPTYSNIWVWNDCSKCTRRSS